MITFYYRTRDHDPLPTSLAMYPAWQEIIARSGGLIGPACWIVQTFLHLHSRGYACRLTQDRPSNGVVITHYDDMPAAREERGSAYWVCVLADRQNVHPFANFHVLQNPYQTLRTRQPAAHVLHWKQPGIVPRSLSRGELFTNVRFFGERISLAAEFSEPDFEQWCDREGFVFQVVPRDRWHDYGDCDAVVGVRNLPSDWVHDKPPSKLVNAWNAGVPAILGRESSFRGLGKPGESYLEASTMEDVKRHLLTLRDDPQRRQAIVHAGSTCTGSASDEAVAQMWINCIDQQIKPRAERWQRHVTFRLWHRAVERLLQGLVWRYKLVGTSFGAR
ncbi:MAG: glycosyltransferase [Rubrivivax sp.]